MKKIGKLLLSLIVLIMISCAETKEDIIRKLVKATNTYNKDEISTMLTDDFTFKFNQSVFDKNKYLQLIDTIKPYGYKSQIDTLIINDSTINSIEPLSTKIDSLLGINELIKRHITYLIKGNKINSIIIDSVSNTLQHNKETESKYNAITLFIQEVHPEASPEEVVNEVTKFIKEFNNLSEVKKIEYQKYGSLLGSYVSRDNKFYKKLKFKGKSTVVIIDAIFGMSFPTSYVLDGKYIRISTDQSDLLLEIQDANTLVGEGFASGKFVKVD